jgi:hypothetical protein
VPQSPAAKTAAAGDLPVRPRCRKSAHGHLGHNLVGNSQGGSGYDTTDLLDVDPLLGPLQNNGGLTKTMALLPGSPAIDAGDNTNAPEWDQRGPGYPRIVNGVIDIGAFEVQSDGSGSSAPGGGRGKQLDFASLVAGLSLPTAPLPLWSAAPFSDPAATLGLISNVLPFLHGLSDHGEVSEDQGFALFAEEVQEMMMKRWPDLEPVRADGSNPELLREPGGMIL